MIVVMKPDTENSCTAITTTSQLNLLQLAKAELELFYVWAGSDLILPSYQPSSNISLIKVHVLFIGSDKLASCAVVACSMHSYL